MPWVVKRARILAFSSSVLQLRHDRLSPCRNPVPRTSLIVPHSQRQTQYALPEMDRPSVGAITAHLPQTVPSIGIVVDLDMAHLDHAVSAGDLMDGFRSGCRDFPEPRGGPTRAQQHDRWSLAIEPGQVDVEVALRVSDEHVLRGADVQAIERDDSYLRIQTQKTLQTPPPFRRSDCSTDDECADYSGLPKSKSPKSALNNLKNPFIGFSVTTPLQ